MITAAIASGSASAPLVGEPAFYGRLGFRAEPALVLPGVPPEYFQAACLEGPMPAGIVTFDPAFEAKS